ncbi:hypothetical protein [Lelliottia sp. CFBP8978]|uniref:hypothetical protein n=1 Tax=Lelliottia sp. CFBP8978 TaxID=3096522 RepID=UPI002A6B215C|nr:hypothetical protein [Lelliottia sp. CFBP8978]MDY1038669.1 hypothetical protein [Lelliottia sp. CFBP8978]
MRKFFFVLLSLFSEYALANSFDLPVVHSTKNGNQCEITFNNKVVSKHDCEYESPSYLTSYSLLPDSWTGVWVFHDVPMGNSCEAGPIRVISMDAENKIETYNPIDYCSGKLTINNDGNRIEIQIRDNENAKNTEVWQFKDNKLLKLK